MKIISSWQGVLLLGGLSLSLGLASQAQANFHQYECRAELIKELEQHKSLGYNQFLPVHQSTRPGGFRPRASFDLFYETGMPELFVKGEYNTYNHLDRQEELVIIQTSLALHDDHLIPDGKAAQISDDLNYLGVRTAYNEIASDPTYTLFSMDAGHSPLDKVPLPQGGEGVYFTAINIVLPGDFIFNQAPSMVVDFYVHQIHPRAPTGLDHWHQSYRAECYLRDLKEEHFQEVMEKVLGTLDDEELIPEDILHRELQAGSQNLPTSFRYQAWNELSSFWNQLSIGQRESAYQKAMAAAGAAGLTFAAQSLWQQRSSQWGSKALRWFGPVGVYLAATTAAQAEDETTRYFSAESVEIFFSDFDRAQEILLRSPEREALWAFYQDLVLSN